MYKRKYAGVEGVFSPSKKGRTYTKKYVKKTSDVGVFKHSFTGPESKNFDTTFVTQNIQSTAVPVLVNAIAAGTGANNMLGRRITITSIQFAYAITADYTISGNITNNTGDICRIMAIYDREPEGVIPALSDIFEYTATNLVPLAPMKLANADRFTVLFNELHAMGANNALTGTASYSLTSSPLTAVNKVFRRVKLPMEGPSSSGIVGINTGAIYLLTLSMTATTNFSLSGVFRTRYTDN